MRDSLIIVAALLLVISCNAKKSAYKLDKVEKKMTYEQVEKIAGKPTNIEDLGVSSSENGDTIHLVAWYFGNNESVTFINGLVDNVDIDRAATQKRLQEIIDSAKQATGQY
jgi:hypothetical protein